MALTFPWSRTPEAVSRAPGGRGAHPMHDVRSAGRPGTGRPVLRMRPAPVVRVRRNLDHAHRPARTRRAPLRRLRHQSRPSRPATHGAVLMRSATLARPSAPVERCGSAAAAAGAIVPRHPAPGAPMRPPAPQALRCIWDDPGEHGQADHAPVPELLPTLTPRPLSSDEGRGRAHESGGVVPLPPRVHNRRYGKAPRRLRARWAPIVAGGRVRCARCSEYIKPGQAFDLGHPDRRRDRRTRTPLLQPSDEQTSRVRIEREQAPQPKRVSRW